MQNSTLVWIIIAALVILGGGWYFLNNQSAPAGGQEEVGETENEDSDNAGAGLGASAGADVMVGGGGGTEESAAPMNASVAYSSTGFSPSTVTVKVGGTVTWSAQGGSQMWVASAQHPTHTAYDGTTLQEHCGTGAASGAFDQCASGTSYSFTFNKAGTWRYHNHSNSSHFGTVIVEE
ncbi:hypothetical protein A3F55_00170 [Candidatus Adlerbacteria bacterium RIFCSPHIGHO2_12_FULL_53_18]|uniref:Blue (type 1) copper domain-containing protein n=1 Tax=Candidatus Adlerbacteria bacterium RIFCSPHIGHO2_12_FULL_53_18 TaxID=1797242 RepID=A0A1F4XT72_9BACT|nr:MAG: hypothetical protein A3F55_00170 [Candidatus Adlerbacteria bacterium RIFCSPHIGHO2_12_FULL_53_18]